MTNPNTDLYICLINFICGIFFFIIYYAVLLLERNKKTYIIYFLDFTSIIVIGSVYLFILDSNKITFHLYDLIFITLGYLLGLRLFKKQLYTSYLTLNCIFSFFYLKFKIIFKWCFDIIPFTIIKNKIKIFIFKYKIKRIIKKVNKNIIKNP